MNDRDDERVQAVQAPERPSRQRNALSRLWRSVFGAVCSPRWGTAPENSKSTFQTPTGLMLWALLVGCAAAHPPNRTSWSEEVLLHDGGKLTVERSQTYYGRSEPGQPAPVGEHRISFRLPGSDRPIVWTSEYDEDLGRTNFNLLALHVKDSAAYIVASPNLCPSYNKWGRPNPPYVIFKRDSGRWRRISIEDLPAEFMSTNVVLTPSAVQAKEMSASGLVKAEAVKRRNRSFRLADEYRSIRRDPLSPEPCPRYPSGPKAPHQLR